MFLTLCAAVSPHQPHSPSGELTKWSSVLGDYTQSLIPSRALIFDAPWKVRNHIERLAATPWMRAHFLLAGVPWADGLKVFGTPILQRHRQSEIRIGTNVELRSAVRSNPLAPRQPVVLSTRNAGAVIKIGNDCGLTGVVVVADERVEIGDRVLIGANSTIVDTDFHPLTPEARKTSASRGACAAVIIGSDVFIGMQAIILKGVCIGSGSVIGAGSVVVVDVPPRTIVAGNPARVVGQVKASR